MYFRMIRVTTPEDGCDRYLDARPDRVDHWARVIRRRAFHARRALRVDIAVF